MTLVPATVTSLEAFRRMYIHRSSGVGVLSAGGTLCGHLSATDLRNLAPGSFHTLLLPVLRFLETRPLLRVGGDDVRARSSCFCCVPPVVCYIDVRARACAVCVPPFV